ncbi:NAD-dependent epimerase [Pantoea coffeiphila]|uniref:NAD-dependent epimerase n=1 Tax=Pantoea coffeiphila TaxID=1465635 RepID=UPI001962221C|nr:NAD-dependent epimerase [Pantoea coffeiphila]MBM7343808.1 UDP-glucuronate 4-epimerase [Pantoea coffeiphila]
MKYLVTGAAGFIGFHVCNRLLSDGFEVVGLDNINDYYDVSLKEARLEILKSFDGFSFEFIDLANKDAVLNVFSTSQFKAVIHLGAQAGVRYSIENPYAYINSNIVGHLNILEGCKISKVEHLLYASSSSVYGLNRKLPFSTNDSVDHPVSLYAATKKSNELMSHTYSHLFDIPTTGLRFFTVYGPYGRPDMALFKFTKAIIEGNEIDIYNNGNMSRDFTYIDDIVESIIRLKDIPPVRDDGWTVENGSPAQSSAPYRVYNIGNGKPVSLMSYISQIEFKLGIDAKKNYMPLQQGDVLDTFSDTNDLYELIDFKPETTVEEGVGKFIDWYRDFYKN